MFISLKIKKQEKKTSIIEKEINPSRSAIERQLAIQSLVPPTTGPLDSEPAVDLVVDLDVVVRNKGLIPLPPFP